MQNSFNLKDVIEHFRLDKIAIRTLLFPNNEHPDRALNRVLSGKMQLDANQLAILANYIGVSVNDLYNSGSWRHVKSDQNDRIVFMRGDIVANLDISDGSTLLINKNRETEILLHDKSISLTKYFSLINRSIPKSWRTSN